MEAVPDACFIAEADRLLQHDQSPPVVTDGKYVRKLT